MESEPVVPSETEGLLLVSAAAEWEREWSFVVLGILESDVLEVAKSTPWIYAEDWRDTEFIGVLVHIG